MFSNGVYLKDLEEELKNKYGYSPELAQEIVVVTQDLEEYFGKEFIEAILAAVKDTKVILVDGYQKSRVRETVSSVLDKEGMGINTQNEGYSLSDIRNIESMYVEKPNLVLEDGTVKVSNVRRLAVINSPLIEDSPNFRSLLIKELSTAVTAHLNEMSIEGDTLTTKRGLELRTEKLSLDINGNVQRTPVKSSGYGLENGLRDYDKLGMSRFYDENLDLRNHYLCVLVAGTLVDGFNLREIINIARVTKDDTELRNLIDGNLERGYTGLIESLDNLYDLEKKSISLRSIDRNDALEAADKLEAYYRDVVAPMVRELRQKLKIGMSPEDMNLNQGNTI